METNNSDIINLNIISTGNIKLAGSPTESTQRDISIKEDRDALITQYKNLKKEVHIMKKEKSIKKMKKS